MLVSDAEQMPLEPGYVYLAPCGSKCGFFGRKTVTKLYFHINLQTAEGLADVFSSLTHFSRIPIPIGEIEELTRQMLEAIRSTGEEILAGKADKTPSPDACKFCPVVKNCSVAIKNRG